MYTSVKSKGKLRRENNVRAQGRIKDLCLEGKNLKNNNLGGQKLNFIGILLFFIICFLGSPWDLGGGVQNPPKAQRGSALSQSMFEIVFEKWARLMCSSLKLSHGVIVKNNLILGNK
jgi:hypothetical protein